MRKILALLVLLAVAAFWSGCASDTANTANNSSVGTTTYNKSDTTSNASTTSAPTTSAPSGNGPSNTAAPKGTPPTRIKPPT